jgi:hypothetical protein
MKTGRRQIEHALVRTAYFSAKPDHGLSLLLRPVGAIGVGGLLTSPAAPESSED